MTIINSLIRGMVVPRVRWRRLAWRWEDKGGNRNTSKVFLDLVLFLCTLLARFSDSLNSSPSMSTFALNCLLLNDDPKRQLLTVEIPETKNVSILKELIKAKKAPHLDDLAASDLILWKVRLPPGHSQS